MTGNFDRTIIDFIYFNLKNPFLDAAMSFFTSIGNNGIIWIFIGAWFNFFLKDRKTFVSIVLSLILCLVTVNFTLKPLVKRERPFVNNLSVEVSIDKPQDYSFPSGHTASSFAGVTAIWLCTNRKNGLLALGLCLCITFSRLYFYVHYPTDVAFGALLGVFLGVVGSYLGGRLKNTASKANGK